MRSFITGVAVFLVVIVLPVWGIYQLTKIRWSTSNTRVSGVVYNVKNDVWISGATEFSVRASEDTVVTEENQSSYCLPKGSPYIDLVNEASEDKRIKVIVRTAKVSLRFVEGTTTCVDNVTVERIED